jgi:DNA-binding XRE family transcriptional regulator
MRKNLAIEVRQHLGVTQRELAETVGCHQADISNLERGARALSAEQCLVWAKKLRRPLQDLGFSVEDLLKLGRR